MKIKVLLFGGLRHELGIDERELELQENACVLDLLPQLITDLPARNVWQERLCFAVNLEHATGEKKLQHGDEVALMPPMAGG